MPLFSPHTCCAGSARHLRAAPALFAAAVITVQLAAGSPPRPASPQWSTSIGSTVVTQGTLMGRYVLRSVNGQRLPVTIPGEDAYHTMQVTDGFLELNADGSYLCRTIATAANLGLKESFSDTLIGTYSVVTPGTIQLSHKGQRPDTVAAAGFQIAWSHPLRLSQALFLYSK